MSGQRYVICESQQYKGCVQLSGWSFWQSATTLAWAKACYGKEDYALDRRSNPKPLHVCHSLVPPITLPDGTHEVEAPGKAMEPSSPFKWRTSPILTTTTTHS